MSFQDKRVLITGATSDIGAHVVSRLADAGARIVMLGRSQRKLEQIGASVATCRHRPACVTVDLLCSEGIETAVRGILEDLKGIDIFLHLAGVWHDGTARYQGPEYWQTPLDRTQEVLQVGLLAPMAICRHVIPSMVAQKSGKILCISCGFAGSHEAQGWVHYYTANLSIRSFVNGLAAELRPFQVQANCLAPWFVATKPVERHYAEESKTALDPADVANAALWLVSPEARHVTGQVIELRSDRDFVEQADALNSG